MADFRQSFAAAGLSVAAANIALQARRCSTRATYSSRFRRFRRWCADQPCNPYTSSVGQVADFLVEVFLNGAQARTVAAYRTAIGALHHGFHTGSSVSNHPILTSLLKGMFNIRPPTRNLVPEWDLPLVLQFIASREFSSLRELSLIELSQRTAFLLSVACGRRCSEMQALSILPQHMRLTPEGVTLLPRAGFLSKTQALSFTPEPIFLPDLRRATGDREDRAWCPVRCLKAYLNRTRELRGSIDQLFVTTMEPRRPLSKTALSRWIVALVRRAYEKLDQPAPSIRAHDTRSQSASWAYYSGVPLPEIMASAGWRTQTTFQQVYLRDVLVTADHRSPRTAVAALSAGRRR